LRVALTVCDILGTVKGVPEHPSGAEKKAKRKATKTAKRR
jgi:hypothetical protein